MTGSEKLAQIEQIEFPEPLLGKMDERTFSSRALR
jgi:hypothetical protein